MDKKILVKNIIDRMNTRRKVYGLSIEDEIIEKIERIRIEEIITALLDDGIILKIN